MVGLKTQDTDTLGADDQAKAAIDCAFEHADIGALLGIGRCRHRKDRQQGRREEGGALGQWGKYHGDLSDSQILAPVMRLNWPGRQLQVPARPGLGKMVKSQ